MTDKRTKKDKIVVYGADWCGHCQTLKGDWAGKDYDFVNCADTDNKTLCDSFKIDGYPTVVYYPEIISGKESCGFKSNTRNYAGVSKSISSKKEYCRKFK